VPRIGISPDKLLLGRMFAYADTTGTGSARTTRSCRSTSPRRGNVVAHLRTGV
jgi:hypothetical protein